MSARGILSNPALFAGYSKPPLKCIDEYMKFSIELGQDNFKITHHHVLMMLEHYLTNEQIREFNNVTCTIGIMDFLEENLKNKK